MSKQNIITRLQLVNISGKNKWIYRFSLYYYDVNKIGIVFNNKNKLDVQQ